MHYIEDIEEGKYKKKVMYLVIFSLIYLSFSFVAISYTGIVVMIMLFGTALISILTNIKELKVRINEIFLLLCFTYMAFFTMLVNNDDVYQYGILIIYIFVAFIIYTSLDFKYFIKVFIKIMYFLCCFSLVTYILTLTFPSIICFFPVYINSQGLPVHNLFFSVVSISSYSTRNFGLFWEPGAYQTIINLALMFELFAYRKPRIKYMVIFLITIVTTMSTTGYIVGGLLCIGYIISNKDKTIDTIKHNKKNLFILIILLVLVVIIYMRLPDIYKFQLFGKLEILYNEPSLGNYTSTTTRIDSIVIPIKIFFKSPIWGLGYEFFYNFTRENGVTMTTCTLVNWFALFGFMWGIICTLLLCANVKAFKTNLFVKIVLIIVLILIIFSEDYHRNPFIYYFIFAGGDMIFKRKYKFKGIR